MCPLWKKNLDKSPSTNISDKHTIVNGRRGKKKSGEGEGRGKKGENKVDWG